MVARLWLAIEPIQVAARASSGRWAAMPEWLRISAKVAPAPMTMDSGRLAMKHRSSMPHRLTSFDAGRRPAAWATISSVPPAIGIHSPGWPAMSSSTAARPPGATIWWASASPRISRLLRLPGGGNYRFEDADEAGTTAKITGEAFANLRHRRVWIALEQMVGGHQHARGADAALRAPAGQERLLQGLHFAVVREALNGFDAFAVHLQDRHEATVYQLAVQSHGARTTFAFAAAFLGSGEVQVFAQHVKQALHGRDAEFALYAIH